MALRHKFCHIGQAPEINKQPKGLSVVEKSHLLQDKNITFSRPIS